MEQEKKKDRKLLYGLLLVIFIGVFSFSIYKIYFLVHDHSENLKEVQTIQDEIILNKEEIKKEEKVVEEKKESVDLELDFPKLKQMNSDTVGWIEIQNTHINYPIVQTDNNDYYLNHSFTKSNNGDGWIFLSYMNHGDFSDGNSVIFGHDTHANGMFSDLKKIYNGSLESSIPITIYLENTIYYYETIAVFLTEENNNQFLKTKLYSKDIKQALENSKIDFHASIGEEETYLTLSTCYNTSSNKVILIAKRV